MYSGNEFHMSTPSNQEFCFQTLLYFENEIKDYLFYELDLENDKNIGFILGFHGNTAELWTSSE